MTSALPNAAPPEASTTKRQRLVNCSPPSSFQSVLDVEGVLRGLLPLLDLAALASLLEILANDESWRGIFDHETLWKELTITHFKGEFPPIEEFDNNNAEVEEEEVIIIDEDEDEEESDDEDDEEQEDQNRSEATQIETPEPESEDMMTLSSRWVDGLPSQKVLDLAGLDLKRLLESAQQLLKFDALVQIIRGDIGAITTVGEHAVDGLAFPTARYLRNPHIGAAAAIFRRAGHGLDEHVGQSDVLLRVGDVHVTPGFNAGVAKLIHIAGPSSFDRSCLKALQRTYRNVLSAIQQEELNCVAMTSVSTGNMGLPVDQASWYALCAMQRYLRSTSWTATIAMVCYEAEVYEAFVKNKNKLLSMFNAESIRADPPRLRMQ